LDISGSSEVVGMKKSNKNCHQRTVGSILALSREDKTEMPVYDRASRRYSEHLVVEG